ncbi:hypothetical protein QKW60_05550 [Defluviimonas aestuarii]|uniref:hypothetical protein n=1 Tax=Albidovulum aestuarii TaxID=1130726 RepID=UPI002499FF4A|nr:hypothetical protein [Defluviimonas aestuarii]MDI3335861.1 hypothetical protein [Defluviimonas aestuarii]
MTVVAWPTEIPVFESVDWRLSGFTQSPGRAMDGREQFVWRENRVWRATITLPALRGSKVSTLRAAVDQMRGRFVRISIPVCNRYTTRYRGDPVAFYASVGITAQQISAGYLRYSDGTTFSDGAGFALPDYQEPVAMYAASAGASRIKLHGYLGRHLSVGAYFTINNFLYRVQSNDDGDIRFNPPLREAVLAGASVDVSNPTTHVRLESDDEFRVAENHNRITSQVTFDVVEAFDR